MPDAELTTSASDTAILTLWSHGRGLHTRRAHECDAGRFLAFVGKSLGYVALNDVQTFADGLADSGLALASRARILAAVKSLLSFAHKMGYATLDAGRPLKLLTVRNQLAERILSEAQVHRLLALDVEGAVWPHWLRHAHASHALDRGAPIHLVQATLGHGSLATTSRYVYARPEDSSSRYLSV